jgi:hypothetical protein
VADLQTIFGSINSLVDQTTNSILKIEDAQNRYNGTSPTRYAGSTGLFQVPQYSTTQWVGIAVLGLVVLLGGYILYKEFK